MKKSKLFSIDFRDLIKGTIMAALGAGLGLILASLEAGSLNFDWSYIGKTAAIAGGLYLVKNFLTNSNDEFATREPV